MAQITESTMRSSVFKALHTTLDANKPTGWTIKSKMPQLKSINSSLPIIVYSVSVGSTDLMSLDKATSVDYTLTADFMFLASETDNSMEDLDVAVDTVREILKNNQSTWVTNGFFVTEITEEISDMDIIGGNRLLSSALSCQIKPIVG
jgi:hypothetical protein